MGYATVWVGGGQLGGGTGGLTVAESLLENLIAMGIELDRNNGYPAQDLSAQILQILETSKEEFVSTVTDTYTPDFGFFGIGEQIPLQEVTTVTSGVRVKSITVEFTGEGANTVVFHGEHWTEVARSNNDEDASNRYLRIGFTPPEGGVINLPTIREVINELTFEGNESQPVHANVKLKVTLHSGASVSATGFASFNIVYDSTWYLTSLMYPTWGEAEASGKTWAELNVFDKTLVKVQPTES